MNYGSYSDELDSYSESDFRGILRRGNELFAEGKLSAKQLMEIRPYNSVAHKLYSWAFLMNGNSPTKWFNQVGKAVVDNSNIPSPEEARKLFDELIPQEYVAMRYDMPYASNHRQR